MTDDFPEDLDMITELRRLLRGARSDAIRQDIAEHVYQLLVIHGRFLRDHNSDLYYFARTEHILYQLNTREFGDYICFDTGINPASMDLQFVLAHIRVMANRSALRMRVHRFSHYDDDKGEVYLNLMPNQIVVISQFALEKVPNGSDDIYFVFDKEVEPVEINLEIGDEKEEIAYSILVDSANFDDAERGTLTALEQKYLYWKVLQVIIFLSSRRTKPPLVILGEPGSGKTTLLRRFGVALFGEKFEVQSLTEDERDILTALSYRPFVVIDNVDVPTAFLNDLIAKVATGIAYHRRQLYTDNEEIRIVPRAHLAITSMEPHFQRADVADRILIFRLKRSDNQEFLDEHDLVKQVVDSRHDIIQGLILAVQKSLQKILSRKELRVTTTFRMADAARFLIKASDKMEYMAAILEKMTREQTRFVAEGNALVDVLCEWLGKNPDKQSKEYTTAQLYSELKTYAFDEKSVFPFKSTRSLGMALTNQKRALATRLDVTERKGSNNVRFFQFSVPPAAGH